MKTEQVVMKGDAVEAHKIEPFYGSGKEPYLDDFRKFTNYDFSYPMMKHDHLIVRSRSMTNSGYDYFYGLVGDWIIKSSHDRFKIVSNETYEEKYLNTGDTNE